MALSPIAAETARDVPRLIEELLGMIQSETRRPPSPAVLRISTRLETAALTPPKIAIAEDSQWHRFKLTAKESELASFLWSHSGKAVHRSSIFAALYPEDGDTIGKIIDVLILRINRKVAGWYRIENERNFGFRMVWTRSWGVSRDVVEWRGVFMGRKASLMAELLFTSKTWVHHRDLAKAAGAKPNAVGRIMAGLRKNLIGTRYAVVNVRCAGYRMELKPT